MSLEAMVAVACRTEDPMKLSDTQLVVLCAAAQREDRGIELPPKLRGGSLRHGFSPSDNEGRRPVASGSSSAFVRRLSTDDELHPPPGRRTRRSHLHRPSLQCYNVPIDGHVCGL